MTNVDKLRTDIINSDSFCFYPFLEISTNPSGYFKPCCIFNDVLGEDSGKRFNILKNDNFDDVWNSKKMISIRKNMHQGNLPSECIKCRNEMESSMRVRSIHEYINDEHVLNLVNATITNEYSAMHSPLRLELKPSSLCNLKCVMCNGYDSTQIAKELSELSSKYGGIKTFNGRFIDISKTPGISELNDVSVEITQPDWSDIPEIWENFERLVPNLTSLSFAGGEPTIMPSVLKALTYCVTSGHANHITVYLSSNFTNLNKNFFNLMQEFKRFELISSIDGFELVNEYCRYPSKWSQISENYKNAKKLTAVPNVKIMTNITVTCLNVLNLVDLLEWIEIQSQEYPYFKEWPYNINMLTHPEEQHVSILPRHLKDEAKRRLYSYLDRSSIIKNKIISLGLDKKIHMIINELDKETNQNALDKFKKRIKILDEHRGINIVNYIPELAEMFND